MATEFVIEKGVPLPGGHRNAPCKYPFRKMEIGDSVFIPGDFTKIRGAVANSALNAFGRGKSSTRKVDGGVRVWRLA